MKLTSSRTQLPYEYYSLPFCQPNKITYKAENLGKPLVLLLPVSQEPGMVFIVAALPNTSYVLDTVVYIYVQHCLC